MGDVIDLGSTMRTVHFSRRWASNNIQYIRASNFFWPLALRLIKIPLLRLRITPLSLQFYSCALYYFLAVLTWIDENILRWHLR